MRIAILYSAPKQNQKIFTALSLKYDEDNSRMRCTAEDNRWGRTEEEVLCDIAPKIRSVVKEHSSKIIPLKEARYGKNF